MAREIKPNRKNKVDKELSKARKEKSERIKQQQMEKIENTITLSNDQIEAVQIINENDITALVGNPGSGKTLCACYAASQALLKREISKIIITRPMVGTEDMGFLPGSIAEKYDPWLMPIYQNLEKFLNEGQMFGLKHAGRIEMLPLQFTRGITYDDSYVIIDECQNVSISQIKCILTRIGKGSKIILCGDTDQIDLRKKQDSGLKFLIDNNFDEIVNGFGKYRLTTEHRKQIVIEVLNAFKNFNY